MPPNSCVERAVEERRANTLEVFTQTQSISSKAFLPHSMVVERADLGKMSRKGYNRKMPDFLGFNLLGGWKKEKPHHALQSDQV